MIHLDVAATGSGKTSRSTYMGRTDRLDHLQKRVVDPEREYVLEYDYEQINPKSDIVAVLNWIEATFLIVDCANYYFPDQLTNEKKRILLSAIGGARHRGNYIYLNFHALAQVPYYIRPYIDKITLGHTNDAKDVLKRYGYKDDQLSDAFFWLRTKLNKKHAVRVI